MGLIFRKSFKVGRRSRINLSKTGASASYRLGPITINSRGRISIRLWNGVTWRL